MRDFDAYLERIGLRAADKPGWQTIHRTLAAVGGNRRLAAAKLGIGLRTLYEKLKRYDLR